MFLLPGFNLSWDSWSWSQHQPPLQAQHGEGSCWDGTWELVTGAHFELMKSRTRSANGRSQSA